eukprot:CAMPEP_0182866272 /NCGR_PEP_ID=MMETSP0034_2-20130328/8123_1 /TAXON_ID=156128 /ORGANISM="Nephroselmis pyriformis, Strain CCMP717" /LENGTH=141 /DNA_ID=CAMNT_0024998599 /DNA_START=121 /DNA_END=543 /DNA_ORIENTATION=+
MAGLHGWILMLIAVSCFGSAPAHALRHLLGDCDTGNINSCLSSPNSLNLKQTMETDDYNTVKSALDTLAESVGSDAVQTELSKIETALEDETNSLYGQYSTIGTALESSASSGDLTSLGSLTTLASELEAGTTRAPTAAPT